MSIEQNVPKVRFNGFSGNWESSELSELAEIVRGASPRPIDDPKWFDKNSKVGWLRIRDVTEQNGRIHHLGQRISKEGEGKTRVLHESHLLLSIAASVGKPVINYVSTGVHDGFLIFRKPSFDMEFMYQWLKSFELKWQQYGQPGSQVNLNSDIVKLQAVSLPCKDEQVSVGNYFQKLDTLIKQHQQKHDKLSNLKKAMLEKMFPKAGETVPEIRFDGFSGDWEERHVGDVIDCFSGGTPSVGVQEYYRGSIPFIRSAEINKARTELTITETGLKNSSAKVIEEGTILYALYGATSGEVGIAKIKGAINQAILAILPKEGICSEFLTCCFKKNKEQILSTYLQGGQGNLSGSIVKGLLFKFPDSAEQVQIGNYFKKLDELINQNQQQITKLKNIKQACLDKMFV